jgi:putative endonuclease
MSTPNIVRPVTEWRDPRHRRGLAGELAAARYLAARGWSVLAHRFRYGRHDIDLIARSRDLVAFIEVKTRQSAEFGDGTESIGWRKRAVIQLGAEIWRARHGRRSDRYRFDVVIVRWGGAGFPRVFHIEDAWRGVEK